MQILEKIANIVMKHKMGLAINRKMKAHGGLSWNETKPTCTEPDRSPGDDGHIRRPAFH